MTTRIALTGFLCVAIGCSCTCTGVGIPSHSESSLRTKTESSIVQALTNPRELLKVVSTGHIFISSTKWLKFGCATAEQYLPTDCWEKLAVDSGSCYFASYSTATPPPESSGNATYACWLALTTGSAPLVRKPLLCIVDDGSAPAVLRCQAVRALGSILDSSIAVILFRHLSDPQIGSEIARTLAEQPRRAVQAFRSCGPPQDPRGFARTCWLMTHCLTLMSTGDVSAMTMDPRIVSSTGEFDFLVKAYPYAPDAVLELTRRSIEEADSRALGYALATMLRLEDAEILTKARADALRGEGTVSELALQLLGSHEDPSDEATLLGVAQGASLAANLRAAAILGLAKQSIQMDQVADAVASLAVTPELRVAALYALSQRMVLSRRIREAVAQYVGDPESDVAYLAATIIDAANEPEHR